MPCLRSYSRQFIPQHTFLNRRFRKLRMNQNGFYKLIPLAVIRKCNRILYRFHIETSL